MENELLEPETESLWDDVATVEVTGGVPRPDGWTPFARKLFLTVLADTGRVSLACEYTQRSRQSAYALRARDRLFALSWDAACEQARAPLADALYERALDGVTETITRNGEVIAERHRHDSRLSIAVLHRLDKRCDRAEERGSKHLALLANWHDWLELVGKGEESQALAMLESGSAENPQHCQACQLPLGESPIPEIGDDDLSHRYWKDDEGNWMTDFPPPPDFEGYRVGTWGDRNYQRGCTDEEAKIFEAHQQALEAGDLTHEEEQRDEWLELLKIDIAELTKARAAPKNRHERRAAKHRHGADSP